VAVAPPASEPVNLLLVDDRPENLLALEAILEPLGQHLVRANSGHEALRELLRRDFAVILLDVQMPGMNGFEVAQVIKSREKTKHIPIIFLTAISKEDIYVFKGYEVGAVDYMSKPFNPDILRSKVSVFIDLYRKQQQILRQEQLLRESERRELELRHRAQLLEREAQLAEIVDSAMDAIITFDESGRVTLFNAAAERMFRRKASDVIGGPVTALFPTGFRTARIMEFCDSPAAAAAAAGPPDADAAALAAAAASRQVPHALTGMRAGGDEFPLEVTVSCLRLPSGAVYTLIGRDVTERQRADDALRRQTQEIADTSEQLRVVNDELKMRQLQLEEAMRARNRFYASMSHELRTPINAIIGYNTLLLDNIYGPLNEKQVHGIQRTHKAAKHLLELVNDVLDLSKIEAGKIELSLQPVVFPALVEDLFVTVRPLADEHRTELTMESETDGPRSIVSDPRRVRQILLNLLSNAIKFGEKKPIRVRVVARDDGGVDVSVIDQGVGISEEDLPRIFDEFVQVSNAHQREGGTGLGLPISQRLAQLLGGTLAVQSAPGKGSNFTLSLPKTADPRLDGAIAERRGSGVQRAVEFHATPQSPPPPPGPDGGAPGADGRAA